MLRETLAPHPAGNGGTALLCPSSCSPAAAPVRRGPPGNSSRAASPAPDGVAALRAPEVAATTVREAPRGVAPARRRPTPLGAPAAALETLTLTGLVEEAAAAEGAVEARTTAGVAVVGPAGVTAGPRISAAYRSWRSLMTAMTLRRWRLVGAGTTLPAGATWSGSMAVSGPSEVVARAAAPPSALRRCANSISSARRREEAFESGAPRSSSRDNGPCYGQRSADSPSCIQFYSKAYSRTLVLRLRSACRP